MRFPDLYLVDGSVGVGNGTGESTALPSAMASAATWDLDLAYRYGEVMGKDMRAHGVNVHLGGNVNLVGREPRNGRAHETKGEDPILAGRINAAHLRGTQDQHVVATSPSPTRRPGAR
jgi:beta-glucosidase